MLTLFLRPTVYGFALMLAAILAGIAIGSYLVTPFLDRRAEVDRDSRGRSSSRLASPPSCRSARSRRWVLSRPALTPALSH